ncbi:MAG: class I SAM-dependent methyltransferase [Candidatus Liptonbacteria bacterium]|nr:class I SAM-dependent methyltransferase [Candidatus Liptonbacteria bacterium]
MGLIVTFLLFSTVAALVLRNAYIGITSAPYAGTPKRVIRKALELANLKPGEKFYDLGCGDGRAVIIAAKEFGAHATGYELSWQWYLISKLKLLFSGARNAEIQLKNLHAADLRDADVIFVWLTPKAYPKLERKFKNELKRGARVVAYSSPLPFWNPRLVVPFSDTSRLFLYIK